ncbi:unnamed protein product (macronuclear) [Paramecium tetraurelia]|uniref:AAA+ ATPase domain-containing protein n=1 Tax=Paramecium tetraurelia TaxID=5888 RepID=A0DYP4_PARTE|nr:uncharacterized protein GSPATT00003129001 [Paramecium tetraurelia]CAK88161.1 unnamed protein product [Paramecium tetraurelia]|eukprot:XP_001455558.1 hypothetical protein (macronuclear) [Paramecium tetraurelia strain d4-2]
MLSDKSSELMKTQQIAYFGCQGISEDNHIEIGFQFAYLLNIDDDDQLQITQVSNCNQYNAITIYVQKWSDYMIVQHQKDQFETSLLNNIQIVYDELIFPIFYQEGQFVTFTFKAQDNKGPIAISPNSEINILIEEAQKPEQKLDLIELSVLLSDKDQFESFIEINTELYHNNRLDKLYQITYSSSFPKSYRNYQKYTKNLKKNKQKQNIPKTAIVQFKQNKDVNNKYCFISKFYAKHLGIREGQVILINTQEYDISKESTIRTIKRNQLIFQKIYFNFYTDSDLPLNKEFFIKLIISKIEKNLQIVLQSRVHNNQKQLYFLRIVQLIGNQPEHFLQMLSIINEHNEPKVIGEKEKGLLIKYLEEHVRILGFTSPIQKEIKLTQYQNLRQKDVPQQQNIGQKDVKQQDFQLFLQLFEGSIKQMNSILDQQSNSQCLVICKEIQAIQVLVSFLKTKFEVIKLNLDKLNQQGQNEKLQNVKKFIKHIFWQSRQVCLNDILIIVKGVESIKSIDLIDFQQSFQILISNILSKLMRNQIMEYPSVKLIVVSPSKEYLNVNLEKKFSKEQIIEFNKPKLELRQRIFEQFYHSEEIKKCAEQLAQKSENFNFTQFHALQNRERYLKELNQQISEEWILQQINDLQDQQVQLNKKIPTFKEIGGLKEQKQIILDLFDLPMKYEHLFAKSKIKLPKSVLIYGMPGCGKTYFSLSICNELKINVLTVKGPELLDKYIGSSEQNVRDLFQKAQSLSPCIIFLDEIDSVVPVRTSSHSGVTDRVVNQFLCYLDGVEEGMKGVYIVAASSRPDLIDPAILRPGRIDKHVRIDLPNKEEILQILEIYKGPLEFDGIAEEDIADSLFGLSQADVVSFFKEARIYLTDRIVQLEDFSLKRKVQKIEDFKLTKELFQDIMKNMKPSLSQKQILFYKDVYNRFEKGGIKDMSNQKQALQ